MPPFFALDIFFKYKMFKDACNYLFFRKEFQDLLQLVRWEYEEHKRQCESIKGQISKSKADNNDD